MEKVDKKHKEEIMKRIEEAGDSNNYVSSWDEKGIPISKEKVNIKRGRKAKAGGAQFELIVRRDLEEKGSVVDKWTNNIEFETDADKKIIPSTGKLIPAKKHWKFNPFRKIMMPSAQGTGFPDFISIKHIHDGVYSVIGVEVKMNGILSKEEKQKCAWYLKNKVFSEIWIAKKVAPLGVPLGGARTSSRPQNIECWGKRGKIEYENFEEKYGKKYNNP